MAGILARTYPVAPPGTVGFYTHAIVDTPGVVAANNFLSVFNPASSDKVVVFYQAEIKNYSVGATTAAASLTAFRTTAASGGTQIAAADVSRLLSTDVNPQAEVRVDNPTITTSGNVINGFPPPIAPTGASFGAVTTASTPSSAGLACLPGQGLVFSTASGDVDQRWNLLIVWAEMDF